MSTTKRVTKVGALLALSTLSTLLVLPRDSRGDVAPQYKCATTYPDKPNHVIGSDGRTYCCGSPDPNIKPPAEGAACPIAPWDRSHSGTSTCAGSVTGLVDDTATGDVMAKDPDPLEFFIVPNQACNVCSGTSESALLEAARQKAARFCEKEAKFADGEAKLLSFEPLTSGRRVCDPWRFRCSCPIR